jgi:hypothetical protein
MFPHGVDPADVDKYMEALKRAQMDIDIAPEKYKHFYLKEMPSITNHGSMCAGSRRASESCSCRMAQRRMLKFKRGYGSMECSASNGRPSNYTTAVAG